VKARPYLFQSTPLVLIISQGVNPDGKVSSSSIHYCLTIVFVLGLEFCDIFHDKSIQTLTLVAVLHYAKSKMKVLMKVIVSLV
jgi:hypothetical protein